MKKNIDISGIITGIIITVIGGFILFYITKENVDIKYNLSAPISIPSEKEYVQQLRIQNVGNVAAENIVITLNGNIQKYEIKKYSEQDNYQEYELSDRVGKQICYPKLPKEGAIVITMNVTNPDFLKVEIKHDKGKATEAFSSQSTFGFVFLLFILIICIYIFIGVKSSIDDYWITSVLQYNKKKILTRNKPFLLSESRWKEIRGMAIENEIASIKRDYLFSAKNFQELSALNYLNNAKIDQLKLDNEEQKKIISAAKEYFLKEFRNLRNMLYDKNDYVEMFSISKPDLVEESEWLTEREKLLSSYEGFIKSRCYDIYNVSKTDQFIKDALDINAISDIEKNKIKQGIKQWWCKKLELWIKGLSSDSGKKYINQLFQTEKPDFFSQSEWEVIKNSANEKYLEIVLYELSYSSKVDYEKILKNENSEIQGLPDDCRKKIRKYAKELYCLAIMEDSFVLTYDELDDKYDFSLFDSNRIIRLVQLIYKAQSIEQLINSPVNNINELEVPKTVDKSFWDSIIEYRIQKAELNNKLQKINTEESKLNSKIEKVSKQLDFINSFLNSPDAIDRIEDYDDLFSKGNYENLKKLKSLFNDSNKKNRGK